MGISIQDRILSMDVENATLTNGVLTVTVDQANPEKKILVILGIPTVIVRQRPVAWTLYFSSSRITDSEGNTINRWWSGEGDLTFEGHTWKGTKNKKGSLIEISEASYTENLPDRRLTARMAVTNDSVRRLLTIDLGSVDVQIGWIYNTNYFHPDSWNRVPRYFNGRIGRSVISQGVFECEVETYLGDIDRGVPEYWSYETSVPGDRYAEQARELAGGLEIRWPPFS